jgi:hypothetical protein
MCCSGPYGLHRATWDPLNNIQYGIHWTIWVILDWTTWFTLDNMVTFDHKGYTGQYRLYWTIRVPLDNMGYIGLYGMQRTIWVTLENTGYTGQYGLQYGYAGQCCYTGPYGLHWTMWLQRTIWSHIHRIIWPIRVALSSTGIRWTAWASPDHVGHTVCRGNMVTLGCLG